jgi:hypothetical protein
MAYEDIVNSALTSAKYFADYGDTYTMLPSYVPSQQTAPTKMDYTEYTGITPLEKVTALDYQGLLGSSAYDKLQYGNVASQDYQGGLTANDYNNLQYGNVAAQNYTGGLTAEDYAKLKYNKVNAQDYTGQLMGGDYNALQYALTAPGAIAANTAYKQGYTNLTNQMGGRGLYGSSLMQNQATNNLDSVYQKSLATNAANAAAQRYALQQQGTEHLNDYNATMYGQKLTGAKDEFNAGLQGLALKQQGIEDVNEYNSTMYAQKVAQETAKANLGLGKLTLQQKGIEDVNDYASTMYGQKVAQETAKANLGLGKLTLQEKATEDLNQYNATMYDKKLQAANDQWKAGLLSTQDKREYDVNKLIWDKSYEDALTAWENAKAYEKYQYDVANQSQYDAYEQSRINNYLNIAGQGTASESAAATANQNYLNYLKAIQDSSTAYSTASQSGWLGAAGSLGAGLLKSDWAGGLLSGVGDTATDWLSSLFDGTPTV